MRQLRPETGVSLAMCQNTHPIVSVLFIYLFLTYCIKEGIKGNIFGHYIQKCWPVGTYGLKKGDPLQNLKFSNQIIFGST